MQVLVKTLTAQDYITGFQQPTGHAKWDDVLT